MAKGEEQVIVRRVVKRYEVCRHAIGSTKSAGPFRLGEVLSKEDFGDHAEQIDRLVEIGALRVVEVPVD